MSSPRPDILTFNSLPRHDTLPPGSGSLSDARNEWYFDIRYIHLEPNPAHYLFLMHLQKGFVHAEKLPLTYSSTNAEEPDYSFFPESAEEAAEEIALALIRSFTMTLDLSDSKEEAEATARFAPWKLISSFENLAQAVSSQFKELGVGEELQCSISASDSSPSKSSQVERVFNQYFNAIKLAMGMSKEVSQLVMAPDTIAFKNDVDPEWEVREGMPVEERVITYVFAWLAVNPSASGNDSEAAQKEAFEKKLAEVKKRIETKRLKVLKQEADEGDLDAAVDYAMRSDKILRKASFLISLIQASIWHRLHGQSKGSAVLSRESSFPRVCIHKY
jgi:hypothetical protein